MEVVAGIASVVHHNLYCHYHILPGQPAQMNVSIPRKRTNFCFDLCQPALLFFAEATLRPKAILLGAMLLFSFESKTL
jgi:hypothetical protein